MNKFLSVYLVINLVLIALFGGYCIYNYFYIRSFEHLSTKVIDNQGRKIMTGRYDHVIETTYEPVITVVDSSQTSHTIVLNTDIIHRNSSEFTVGQNIAILYNPNKPLEAKINPRMDSFWELWTLPMTFIIPFIFVSLLMGVGLMNGLRHKNRRNALKETGIPINARIARVFVPLLWKLKSYNIFSIQYYKIVATGEYQGKQYVFKSLLIITQGARLHSMGQLVRVYLDPLNPKHYEFDLAARVEDI